MRRVVGCALFVGIAVMVLTSAVPAFAERSASKVASLDPSETDVEVFMLVQATERQIAAVERAIRSSPQVDRYAHLDQHEAYREFKRIFAENQKLVRSIRPRDLPVSFRVDLSSEAAGASFASKARRLSGVDSAERHSKPTEAEMLTAVRLCQARGATFEVFMKGRATQAQFDQTRAVVSATPGLTIVKVLTHDDAYAEFTQAFASQPDKVQGSGPADLPMSIRFEVSKYPSPAVFDRLEAAPGVDSVETPAALCKDVFDLMADGLTPEQVATLLVERTVGAAA